MIQRQGKDKIIVELPGVKDPEQAIAMLGKTAMLEFKDMEGNTVLTGKDLKDSKASADQSGQPVVTLQFNEEGAKKFADLTARNVGRQIAILLDGNVLTAPRVSEPITGGNAQITGSKDAKEAEHLAILLRSGSLPVKLEVVENRTVGPTLGQDAKDASMKAFAIGLAGVFLFEVPLRGSVFALFVLSSTFLMPALGQGLLISILTKQQLLAAKTGLITGFLPAVIPYAGHPRAAFQHGASDGLPCRGHLARVPSAHGLYARAWRRLFGHHVQEAGEAVGCVNLGRGFPEKGSPSSFLPFSNEGAMGAACYRRSIL